MGPNDRVKFAALMGVLAEVFGGEASENRLAIYFDALKDFTIERVEKAVREIVKTRTTASFPKPGELRQAVEGMPSDRTAQAIQAIRNAARAIGGYGSVTFEDTAILATIDRLGGWPYMCRDFEWDFRRKEFEELFEAVIREDPKTFPAYLIGETEMENKKAFPDRVPATVLIGKNGEIKEPKKVLVSGGKPKQIKGGTK